MRGVFTGTASLFIALVCGGSNLTAGVFQCDNDRDFNQYPNCNNITNSGWQWRTGQPGDWNGDDRIASSSANGAYGWSFPGVASNILTLRVWLANNAFTDPLARYSVFNSFGENRSFTINQDRAPGGWNVLVSGAFFSFNSLLVLLDRPLSQGVNAGADLIELRDTTFSLLESSAESTPDDVDGIQDGHDCGMNGINDTRISIIQQRMLNAIDNYQDIKGNYQIYFKNNGQDELVSFEISEAMPGSYVRTASRNGLLLEHRFDGSKSVVVDWGRSVVRSGEAPAVSMVGKLRHYYNGKCEPVYVHRQDPSAADAASEVAFPQNYAFWLSSGAARIAGSGIVAGRKVTVISGRHDSYLGHKLGAASFQMWVDDKTGTLLKLVGVDEQGVVVYFIEVKEIQFDRGVDVSRFSVSVP